jgi:hypothetical protein
MKFIDLDTFNKINNIKILKSETQNSLFIEDDFIGRRAVYQFFDKEYFALDELIEKEIRDLKENAENKGTTISSAKLLTVVEKIFDNLIEKKYFNRIFRESLKEMIIKMIDPIKQIAGEIYEPFNFSANYHKKLESLLALGVNNETLIKRKIKFIFAEMNGMGKEMIQPSLKEVANYARMGIKISKERSDREHFTLLYVLVLYHLSILVNNYREKEDLWHIILPIARRAYLIYNFEPKRLYYLVRIKILKDWNANDDVDYEISQLKKIQDNKENIMKNALKILQEENFFEYFTLIFNELETEEKK